MSLAMAVEVWNALKSEIDENNLGYAAENLINVLIDNDYEAAEIKQEFRRDVHVMDALKEYVASHEDEEDYSEEDEEDEDDDRW